MKKFMSVAVIAGLVGCGGGSDSGSSSSVSNDTSSTPTGYAGSKFEPTLVNQNASFNLDPTGLYNYFSVEGNEGDFVHVRTVLNTYWDASNEAYQCMRYDDNWDEASSSAVLGIDGSEDYRCGVLHGTFTLPSDGLHTFRVKYASHDGYFHVVTTKKESENTPYAEGLGGTYFSPIEMENNKEYVLDPSGLFNFLYVTGKQGDVVNISVDLDTIWDASNESYKCINYNIKNVAFPLDTKASLVGIDNEEYSEVRCGSLNSSFELPYDGTHVFRVLFNDHSGRYHTTLIQQ